MGIMDYLFAGDPSSLQPSTTGRDAVMPAHLASMPQGSAEDRYLTLMQYLTQPRRDAGPEARRAEAGMPMSHGDTDPSPAGMQSSPVMMQLMARLFGGR